MAPQALLLLLLLGWGSSEASGMISPYLTRLTRVGIPVFMRHSGLRDFVTAGRGGGWEASSLAAAP